MGMIAVTDRLLVPEDALAAYCARWKVARVELVGEGEWDDPYFDGGIGVMVTPRPDSGLSGFDWVHMIDEMAEMLGRKVVLIDRRAWELPERRPLKQHMLDTARTLYVAG